MQTLVSSTVLDSHTALVPAPFFQRWEQRPTAVNRLAQGAGILGKGKPSGWWPSPEPCDIWAEREGQ